MKKQIVPMALLLASLAFAGFAVEPTHSCGKSEKTACCKTESCKTDGSA